MRHQRAGTVHRNLPACHYAALAARASEPAFFVRFGVADTPAARFDLLLLHLWPVLERLQSWGGADGGPAAAQALVDTVFSALEASLREAGAGDIVTFRTLRRLAGDLSGRMQAYAASAGDAGSLCATIRRNLYGGTPALTNPEAPSLLARYILAVRERLSSWRPDAEGLDFGPLPG